MLYLCIALFYICMVLALISGRIIWIGCDVIEENEFVGRSLDVFLGSFTGVVLSVLAISTYPLWR